MAESANSRVNERRKAAVEARAAEAAADVEDTAGRPPVVERAVSIARQHTGGEVHWFSR